MQNLPICSGRSFDAHVEKRYLTVIADSESMEDKDYGG